MIRSPFRYRQLSAVTFLGLGTIVGILIYNTWMVSCGHCTLQMLLTVPWLGWVLIGLNLLAIGCLVFLRRRSSRSSAHTACSHCNITLREGWRYCPCCGRQP